MCGLGSMLQSEVSLITIFAYAKTKAQISCAVTAQLIRAFVFATHIVPFLFYLYPNFMILAFFSVCISKFVSDLVGNPKDLFSCIEDQVITVTDKVTKKSDFSQ